MAQYEIKCELCGKNHILNLFGKNKKRNYIISLHTCCKDFGKNCQENNPDLDFAR